MTVKPFETQAGIILGKQNPQISSGTNSSSPYWHSTLNGRTLPEATLASATAPASAAPIVVLTGQQPPKDGTRVLIQGATGMTGLNDEYYTKATSNANEYELYTDYALTSFNDLSGEDPYNANSASVTYFGYFAVTLGVSHDPNGNVFTAGATEQETGPARAFIAKYSPTGTLLWQKVFDSEQNLSGWGMAVDATGHAYAVVNDEERIHIVKLDGATGSLLWQNAITSPTGEYGYYCELSSDGHVVVGGRIYNSNDGTDDFLTAKVSSVDGTLIWSNQLGYAFDQEAFGVACDRSGPIVVVGVTEIFDDVNRILVAKYTLDGALVWQKTIANFDTSFAVAGLDAAIDSVGNIYLSAACQVSDGGGSAGMFIKLDSNGEVVWTRKVGPGICDTASLSVAVDSDDKIYVVSINGQQTNDQAQFDFVLAKYESDGTPVWQRYWGSKNAWEVSAFFTPAPGQMISVNKDYIAVGGWQWFVDDNGFTLSGAGAAFVAQLPKDGSLVSIGQWTMRKSRFAGEFVTTTSVDAQFQNTSGILEQSAATVTMSAGDMLSILTTDWGTTVQNWTFKNDGSLEAAGGVSVTHTPWAEDIWIGPAVSFVKHNGGDEEDEIDADLIITRDWANGIYNVALEDEYNNNFSPEGTEWNSDGWSNLSNVKLRDYDDWQTVVYPPNSIVGRELVMHDTINDKYYTVKFTSWQSSSMGGGFSYVRRQINTAAYFTKTAYGDEVDFIDTGLSLTRGDGGVIYNPAAGETDYDNDYSPLNTLWNGDGWNNLGDLEARQWLSFYNIMGGANVGKRVLGREWIMWDTNNNEYYAIEFTNWQPNNNGGAFSYIRRKVNKTGYTAGITFPDGSTQTVAFDESAAGTLPQKPYAVSDDRWLNIDDVGKHLLVYENGVDLRLPDAGDQPWRIGHTITIVNRSGGSIYLRKDNDDENGTIYGAGTTDNSTDWEIPDTGGGNICTLICIEMYGYDSPTVNWMLSGPGIVTD